MFGWFRKKTHAPRVVSLQGRYDAATYDEQDDNYWSAADARGPIEANNPQVRKKIRERARYEVANNSYACGIQRTIVNDTIGTGPRLQCLSDDGEFNTEVEAAFSAWAGSVGLADKLRVMRAAKFRDGEALAAFTTNDSLPGDVKLDLAIYETEQLTDDDPNSIDGVWLDDSNRAVRYTIEDHPGDFVGWLNGRDKRYVPASQFIHYYHEDRPGQVRGISELTPSLKLFAQLRRYTLAVITAAETAALPSAVLYTDSPVNGEAANVAPLESIEYYRGSMITMPGGWKMGQIDAVQPTSTYAEFKREILGEVGRCLLVPVNVVTGDSSQHNYASGRLDFQAYYRAIRVEQDRIEKIILDAVFSQWLAEYLVEEAVEPVDHRWFWDGAPHVDPVKEASAQKLRLAAHTTTLADEYAQRGLDWEQQLRQRARELQLLNELGISAETVL